LNGLPTSRPARKLVLLLLISLALGAVQVTAKAKGRRTLTGIIYFTNNTPPAVEHFPIEIFARDRKRRIAVTTPDDKSRFALLDLKPGKYLLKVTWPNQCRLWYRVDLTKRSKIDARIIMDVDCAHFNGTIRDLPEN
jgi:hypothetical protein